MPKEVVGIAKSPVGELARALLVLLPIAWLVPAARRRGAG